MSNYSLDGWMVAWNPGERDSVEVGPWPDRTGWSCRPGRWLATTGCCELARHDWPEDRKVAMMFIDFHTLVVGDGMDPQPSTGNSSKLTSTAAESPPISKVPRSICCARSSGSPPEQCPPTCPCLTPNANADTVPAASSVAS